MDRHRCIFSLKNSSARRPTIQDLCIWVNQWPVALVILPNDEDNRIPYNTSMDHFARCYLKNATKDVLCAMVDCFLHSNSIVAEIVQHVQETMFEPINSSHVAPVQSQRARLKLRLCRRLLRNHALQQFLEEDESY
jgi:hypothetical protein